MALTFTVLAAVATAAGGWIVRANRYGRVASLVVLAVFGLTLVWPGLADRLSRPFVQIGDRLTRSSNPDTNPGMFRSLLLGIATGLLWAPCAGPILGLVLTGAALQGASARTVFLLLAYAAGATTSLAVALLAGGQAFAALKRSLKAEAWIRKILGVAALAGVAAIALGLDRGVLTKLSLASTSGLEQSLIDRVQPKNPKTMSLTKSGDTAGARTMPDLSGATAWLNSPPLNREKLKGKVVLVDFWTYSCINCLRTLPYVRAWAEKYFKDGLVVIGVHTPEFAFEKDPDNVRRAVKELGITYPVALDNDYKVWEAFNNSYWPADYLIDATGHIRYEHFGEGKYDETEGQIRELLEELNGPLSTDILAKVSATGAEAPPDSHVKSHETYIGYESAEHFISPGGLRQDVAHTYSLPKHLELNQWGFSGSWIDRAEVASLGSASGRIAYRFHARDLHLVLGPPPNGEPVRYRVTIDGRAPGVNHGVDTDPQGKGTITEHRLYQLIRQQDAVEDRTFEIEFLDPGVQAFAFTFG